VQNHESCSGKGVQGRSPFKGRFFGGAGGEASLPGFGVSPMLLFLPLAASGGEKNRKKMFCGDTPHPGKGLAALCNPAWRARRQKTYP